MLKWFLRWLGHDDRKQPGLKPLYEGDRGLADLHDNGAVLRLWLPEPLRLAMAQVCREITVRESTYLRELLVVYLYGMHELLVMHSNRSGLYNQPPPTEPESAEKIFYSLAPSHEIIPGLGKNIVPCKLRLPAKLKTDLEALASQRKMPVGRFVRELLVRHFLGHTVWPERMNCPIEQEQIAEDWVEGKTEAIRIMRDFDDEKFQSVEDFY